MRLSACSYLFPIMRERVPGVNNSEAALKGRLISVGIYDFP